MREIKFRIRDVLNKKWLDPKLYSVGCDDGMVRNKCCLGTIGGAEANQFTGLNDKNGREIYEGDILKEESPRGNIYQVYAVPGGFALNMFRDEVAESFSELTSWNALADMQTAGYVKTCEVIGNIYESPELLNQK